MGSVCLQHCNPENKVLHCTASFRTQRELVQAAGLWWLLVQCFLLLLVRFAAVLPKPGYYRLELSSFATTPGPPRVSLPTFAVRGTA